MPHEATMNGSDMILVADIGGTNTRVALGDRAGKLHNICTLKNIEINDLRDPLAEMTASGAVVTDAVLAVAGPVDGETVSITNHPWKISQAGLKNALGLRSLTLINDFLAAAYAVPAVGENELLHLQEGEKHRRGNILVCGPGTGFGAAALIHSEREPVGLASEAGHIILGPSGSAEEAIFSRLKPDGAPIAVEEILSGAGLSNLYRAMHGSSLRSEEIINRSQTGDAKANDAVLLFLKIFGRVTGDLALAYNAMSGVFLAGGAGRALTPHYKASSFLDSFRAHPPYSERLASVPIAVLMHEHPGLLGALQFGLARST